MNSSRPDSPRNPLPRACGLPFPHTIASIASAHAVALWLAFTPPALADSITLKSGTVVEGAITRQTDERICLIPKGKGKEYCVQRAKVVRVDPSDARGTGGRSRRAWMFGLAGGVDWPLREQTVAMEAPNGFAAGGAEHLMAMPRIEFRLGWQPGLHLAALAGASYAPGEVRLTLGEEETSEPLHVLGLHVGPAIRMPEQTPIRVLISAQGGVVTYSSSAGTTVGPSGRALLGIEVSLGSTLALSLEGSTGYLSRYAASGVFKLDDGVEVEARTRPVWLMGIGGSVAWKPKGGLRFGRRRSGGW
ncbi:MAG: hypothetical protein HYY13_08525 [Nitrospirae bacterium]|nr:hypothetical protein [Nitrospirota bacterium]